MNHSIPQPIAFLSMLVILAACQQPQPQLYLVAIDYSGSVHQQQRDATARRLRHYFAQEQRIQSGDRVIFLPIHANTATSEPVIDQRFTPTRGGRAGQQQMTRQRGQLMQQIDSVLNLRFQAEAQYTDILSIFPRAMALSDRYEVNVILISDMIQDNATIRPQSILSDNGRPSETGAQLSLTAFQNLEIQPNVEPIRVTVWWPSGREGLHDDVQRQHIQHFWTAITDSLPLQLNWDSL